MRTAAYNVDVADAAGARMYQGTFFVMEKHYVS